MEWLIGKNKKNKEGDGVLATSTTRENSSQSQKKGTKVPPTTRSSVYCEEFLCSFVGDEGGEVDFKEFDVAIKLPDGIDLNEWIATHAIPFFTNISQLYSVSKEFCFCQNMTVKKQINVKLSTNSALNSLISMTGGVNMGSAISNSSIDKMVWVDEKGKRNSYPANKYTDLALTWVCSQINDPELFPTKRGDSFPQPRFDQTIKKVYLHLYHVLSHMLIFHYVHLVSCGVHPHFNTVFKHFCSFCRDHHLIDSAQFSHFEEVLYVMARSRGGDDENETNNGTGGPVS